MTRFEKELSGGLGAFWKKNAEDEIAKMQERIANGEIGINANGGVFWKSNGRYLPEDCVEILNHTDFSFNPDATAKARDADTAAFIRSYKNNHRTSPEEIAEMRAAFGAGTTIVNIITGEEITL